MEDKGSPIRRQALLAAGLTAAGISTMLMLSLLATLTSVETIPYSRFDELMAKGAITQVTIGPETIEAKLKFTSK